MSYFGVWCEHDIDRQEVVDLLEETFPCPPGENRIDWARRVYECAGALCGMVVHTSIESFL